MPGWAQASTATSAQNPGGKVIPPLSGSQAGGAAPCDASCNEQSKRKAIRAIHTPKIVPEMRIAFRAVPYRWQLSAAATGIGVGWRLHTGASGPGEVALWQGVRVLPWHESRWQRTGATAGGRRTSRTIGTDKPQTTCSRRCRRPCRRINRVN